ncbi:hypothetical protein O2N63_07920 [Aliiroseovarius sp. KMU-50]|uniref:Secreted protein n=1 Tax=Aliiroseovarius salicola TaxID=3009082 RepID=A0ABT4W0I1_9RHOB|nr:hypothetical protein [Aliiroseovarius sp. KMU-50]MDA5094014.1 hypothetical protein [Aliiroseovarius sp. KMU-50]
MLTKSIKLTLPATALMIAVAGFSTSASAASGTTYNLCNLHNAPSHVLKQIADRDDFGDILMMMQSNCAGGAAIFTEAPTATLVGVASDDRPERGHRRERRDTLRR